MRLRPLALGTLGGIAAAAALAPLAADAMRDLTTARVDRATLAQLAAGPAPSRAIVADSMTAPDAGAAADMLAARLRAVARRGGLLVEEATPRSSSGLARVTLRVSGSEDAVIAFADAVERGRPVARFARWSAEARGGGVTLWGDVIAPWQ